MDLMEIFLLGLFGKRAKEAVQSVVERRNNPQKKNSGTFVTSCNLSISKIHLKKEYLEKIIQRERGKLVLLEGTKDCLKRKKQLEIMQIIKIYETQWEKLFAVELQLEKLKAEVDNAAVLENIYTTLFQGSEMLRGINSNMQNVDEIIENIHESLDNLKEIEHSIKGTNDAVEINDDEILLDELNHLVKLNHPYEQQDNFSSSSIVSTQNDYTTKEEQSQNNVPPSPKKKPAMVMG